MKKNTLLLFLLLTASFGFGQILTFEFAGNLGDEPSATSNFNDSGLTTSTITRGPGVTAVTNPNSFTANEWSTTDIADAVINDDYFEFTITPNASFEFSVTSITFNIRRNGAGLSAVALRSSVDNYTTNIDGEKALLDVNSLQVTTFTINQLNNSSAITYRLYGYAETNNGQGRLRGGGDDIVVTGVVTPPPADCTISDYFNDPTIGSEWTDVGGNSSIASNQLSFVSTAGSNLSYIYQDVTTAYNANLSTLSNPISWEFNMRQSLGNPSGFNGNQRAVAFILGATNSDLNPGSGTNGYAVVLGTNGTDTDYVRPVFFEDGLSNGSLNDVVVGTTLGDIGNEYLSIRVIYNPANNQWQLLARNDGTTGFDYPSTLDENVHDQGTVANSSYTNTSLDYIAAVWRHRDITNVNQTAAFDNLCISTSFDCGSPAVTWNGTTWSPSAPDSSTPVIIDGAYSTGTNGSFSACSITVNSGNTFTIADGDVVIIENDVTIDGDIVIQPEGAIIQNNNIAITSGSANVIKKTAPMDAWYEYTYWSSPVSGETIIEAIDGSSSRRYIFQGQNFLDATAETGNNNATDPGQDDVDDNADAWLAVSGTTVMLPGVGYATTLSESAFDAGPGTSGKQFDFSFEGPLNNGIYSVPIYRNDSETNDNNWNFIGNPYPSAIDVDLFLDANAVIETSTVTNPPRAIDGAIYLWSQNTPPSALANGNDTENFSDSDYAIINSSSQIAGGDGVIPDRFIPSGQGFFVTYSDAATPDSTVGDISQGTVVFNNYMRATETDANGEFFKGSSSKKNNSDTNKLWINLTNDNGAFNQTAIAYVNGATDSFDGGYYDAIKPATIVTAAILYSNIEGSDKKFGIQGKDLNSINVDEIISLGFKTNTDESTVLTLSIDHLEGDFLTSNAIYLKDNLLNEIHNLKESNYNFTSEVGEFNSRFEIIFSTQSLSTDDNILDNNSLRIIQLDNDNVKFTINDNLSIKSVSIFDLLGRELYSLKGNNSSETYNLSNLQDAIYIAKVELSNGVIITKKALKK